MKVFSFCISNHGFGHIMRNLGVIEKILSENKKVVVLCGKKQLDFARVYFSEKKLLDNCILIEVDTDFGLRVKKDSLVLDKDLIISGVAEHIANFPVLIEMGKDIIREYHIEHVVSDVTPWILTAAKQLEVSSTLMASFTWLDIYQEFLPNELLIPFQDCYADAKQIILYELANPRTLSRFPNGIQVNLAARQFSQARINQIKASFKVKQPTVFISVGVSNNGVASTYDVNDLPYNFITTQGIAIQGDNVMHLSLDVLDTQNYIAASDFCISKAGWTTLSEMLLAKKPMALLKRDDNAEDRYSINELIRRKQAIGIELSELADLGSLLKKMQYTKWAAFDYHNDTNRIAKLILND